MNARWLTGIGAVCLALVACENEAPQTIDTRLRVQALASDEAATPEKLAYAEAVADVHARASAADPAAAVAVLQAGLAIPIPERFEQAAALRLDLATRLAEIWHAELRQPLLSVELLLPMVGPDASLPLDPATARALVALGDAAAARGDDALAAGSYARALRVLSMLREELE